ncbi:DoxX family membrane protein [Brevibacillus borstelensis]|jgi:uncharacterized membrane protein YphA (DoxX/SURF4 family)|nr:DoxX family membrane protein [Brevibacillus borstelensis]
MNGGFSMKKWLRIAKWTLLSVTCFYFLFIGFFKLNGNPDITLAFQQYGYPYWFQIIIGPGEVLGGLGLLFHKLFRYAAFALAFITSGTRYG